METRGGGQMSSEERRGEIRAAKDRSADAARSERFRDKEALAHGGEQFLHELGLGVIHSVSEPAKVVSLRDDSTQREREEERLPENVIIMSGWERRRNQSVHPREIPGDRPLLSGISVFGELNEHTFEGLNREGQTGIIKSLIYRLIRRKK